MHLPKTVYVGRFRKDGRTATTTRKKTAAAWVRDGHEVHTYIPNESEPDAEIDVAFWEKAFLTVLPSAMEAQGWKIGDTPITSGEARINLAAIWATYAYNSKVGFIRANGAEADNNEQEHK